MNEQTPIRVSTIIPVYNGAATVAAAIDSALAQDFAGQEIIVINDGSTDNTADVLAGYGDRIRVIHQSNRGVSATRNAGIAVARGEYIAFLDADDLWLPGSLERRVAALVSKPEAVLAFGDFKIIDEVGATLAESVFPNDLGGGRAPSLNEMIERTWPILPTATAVRTGAIRACGGFDEGFRTAGWEDFYLWLVLRERGPFVSVPEVIAVHVDHPDAAPDKYRRGLIRFRKLVRRRHGGGANGLLRNVNDYFSAKLFERGWLRMKRAEFFGGACDLALAARYSPVAFARNLKPVERLRRRMRGPAAKQS